MLRNPVFYGISIFVLCLILFGLVLPAATCMDGWGSTSIGSQGACSHHGGVNSIPNVIALIISSAAGFFVWSKANKNKEKLENPDNKKIEIAEKSLKSILSALNLFLCRVWNALIKLLKTIQILKFIPTNGWVFAAIIIFVSIILPPLCFILYPIGIAAIVNGADPDNDFLIEIK